MYVLDAATLFSPACDIVTYTGSRGLVHDSSGSRESMLSAWVESQSRRGRLPFRERGGQWHPCLGLVSLGTERNRPEQRTSPWNNLEEEGKMPRLW